MQSTFELPEVSSSTSLVVVVPTRNRASLATTAIQSALEEDLSGVSVVVSDNSTDPRESDALAVWCAEVASERLKYIRPPEEMPMPVHWNWALQRAFDLTSASHILYLTDRMVYRRGGLARLVGLIRQFPGHVITYAHDRLDDYHRPIRLEEMAWTGNLVFVPSAVLLELFAACRIDLAMPLPRLLNSIVPRAVVEQVRERYRDVCADAVAPDFRFAFRCLTIVDEVLYYDRSELVSYALDRSNGASYSRGTGGQDALDFAANLGGRDMNWASPVPEFVTAGNTMVSEYCATLREAGDGSLPPVLLDGYLTYIRQEIAQLEDSRLKGEMEEVLWRESKRLRTVPRRKRLWLHRLARLVSSPSDTLDFVLSMMCVILPSLRRLPALGAALDRHNFLPQYSEFPSQAVALEQARTRGRRIKRGSTGFQLMLTSASSVRLKDCRRPPD